MDTSSFDPTRAVVFDLERGRVAFEGGAPLLLVPAELVAAICGRLEVGVVRQLGIVLGRQAGVRVRARLGQALMPSLELMVEQLGGELALAGFGAFSVERWGQALVVRIDGYPLAAQGQELMGGYVEGALQATVEREVTALTLERTERTLRLLLCSKAASARVKGWMLAGSSWADALGALNGSENDAVGSRV
jgi:uncharacterized protein YunC (DUF1805 family)